MDITKIKMLKVGKYSWDGKNLRVFNKGQEYGVVDNKDPNEDCSCVHIGVVHQWLKKEEPFCEVIED